jgi:hypothetical protein
MSRNPWPVRRASRCSASRCRCGRHAAGAPDRLRVRVLITKTESAVTTCGHTNAALFNDDSVKSAPVELRFTLCLIQPLMPSLYDGTRAQARNPSVNRLSSLVADPAVGNSTMLCDT